MTCTRDFTSTNQDAQEFERELSRHAGAPLREPVSKLEVEEEGDNKSRRRGVTQYSTVGGSQWILALN